MSILADSFHILKGYVPLDKDWSGFSSEDYQMASQSVYDEAGLEGDFDKQGQKVAQEKAGKRLALFGYQRVRGQYFSIIGG